LLPIIPPDGKLTNGSLVQPHHRGKVPGVLTAQSTWSGLAGKWSVPEWRADVVALKLWQSTGASVGLQGRNHPGLDVDVDDEPTAAAVADLATDYLGLTPVRTREGSPRRLFMYRGAGLRKVRLEFTLPTGNGAKHAVELLATGQQYVVEGPHPKGGEYTWHGDHPCDVGAGNLTEIGATDVDRFFDALRATLIARGATVGRETGQSAALTGGARKPLSDPSMWAPSPQHVLDVLAAWPNELASHDELVAALAAIKAALGPDREQYYGDVEEWILGYPGTDDAYAKKTWDSITDAEAGWSKLANLAGQGHAAAQVEFDDGATGQPIPETAYDRMLARYVYVSGIDRYVDVTTGQTLTSKAFNSGNVAVRPFGLSGEKSAEATFQNAPGARKVATATYRPGQGAIINEQINGATMATANLYRPSTLRAIRNGDATPWLNHVAALFGPAGSATREHFLDWCAFIVQNPGKKINHAIVLLGEPGIGKDTVLVPIIAAVGAHNASIVKPETLIGQFNHFLEAQLIVVEEMMNFSKKETYNKLKDWLAAPPDRIEINRKHMHPYSVPNIQVWIFLTNHDDAIALEDGDRRFWVHRCLLEKPLPPAYYESLYRWLLTEQGNEIVAGWLLDRDISRFNPHSAPPMTEAKEEMLEASVATPIRWIAEQLAENGAFHGRELVTASELVEHARSAFETPARVAEQVREKHACAALRRAGYQTLEGKYRVGAKITRLWTNSARPGLLEQMEARALLARYEADRAKKPA
jgi:hypothetical protein